MTDPTTTGWRQLTITFTTWQAAEQIAATALAPMLAAAEDAGVITAWWFIRKGRIWRLRVHTANAGMVGEISAALTQHETVRDCAETIYEPEGRAFGGPAGIDLAHSLFHADSRYLLAHLAHAQRDRRRELSVVLATRLLRAAGLEWYEQGDCWAQLADHRTPAAATPEPSTPMVDDVRLLLTATTDTADSPLHHTPRWVDAFEHTGQRLAELARRGTLTRGLRAVLTHHMLFLFNRHGVSADDQHLLATAASRTVFDIPAHPTDTSLADTTRHARTDGTGANTVGAVTFEPDPHADRAAQLRDELVDYIASWGTFQTPQVEAAFRTVPRHLFLPGNNLETAYGRKPVVTRRAADGSSVSSASSPKLVATMLEQLNVAPGGKVLEIGAATGINAALLAELVGPTSTVVTIELDDDLAAGAAASLQAAGYPQVKVICGDGALGHPEGAPYDRIIVTAEAWDIVPAWWQQLTAGGRLVVPLRLHGSGLTRAIAFDLREPDLMVSASAVVCGFVPMRGTAEHHEHHVRLADDVAINVDAGDLPNDTALSDTLNHAPQSQWTGIRVRHDEPAEHLDLWLATTAPLSFGRLSVSAEARTAGRANPAMRWGGACLYTCNTLAYVTAREVNDEVNELGVVAHGPDAAKVADDTIELLTHWAEQRPSQPTITAYRAGTPTGRPDAPISRPHTLITITW
ncbi:methyltransferase, FxLD system [Phytohabitans rumicis]|uniref:Protein-L-isoaspartate O-methyltransferase n=1 Tax=Phytohabitans rumicis TaxID=1076125 RepID=A0A6V8LC88_9ACTN|nr:methyltransferase, FxLD system [Phytohabitans rumicis]GFJ93250.1 O-methyltransferase [Phytohabitans rumicis]